MTIMFFVDLKYSDQRYIIRPFCAIKFWFWHVYMALLSRGVGFWLTQNIHHAYKMLKFQENYLRFPFTIKTLNKGLIKVNHETYLNTERLSLSDIFSFNSENAAFSYVGFWLTLLFS